VRRRRPHLNRAVHALLDYVARTMPEFSHIQPSRILVVAGEARRASRGTVKPLRYEPGFSPEENRKKPVVKINGRRMLYCITLRPLFFRNSTPKSRVATILHELFHISLDFDGTLAPGRRHAQAGPEFAKKLRPLLRRCLRNLPKELLEPFAYNGEVKVQQWLERPPTFYVRGTKMRRIYTEEQLFLGSMRMLTKHDKGLRRAL
jgi:hypothetical protein